MRDVLGSNEEDWQRRRSEVTSSTYANPCDPRAPNSKQAPKTARLHAPKRPLAPPLFPPHVYLHIPCWNGTRTGRFVGFGLKMVARFEDASGAFEQPTLDDRTPNWPVRIRALRLLRNRLRQPTTIPTARVCLGMGHGARPQLAAAAAAHHSNWRRLMTDRSSVRPCVLLYSTGKDTFDGKWDRASMCARSTISWVICAFPLTTTDIVTDAIGASWEWGPSFSNTYSSLYLRDIHATPSRPPNLEPADLVSITCCLQLRG